MSNFGDADDQALVQLAVQFSDEAGVINWDGVEKQFPWQKTRLALRQRLQTLKRTYGKNLRRFPPRFYRPLDEGARPSAAKSAVRPRQALVVPSKPLARTTTPIVYAPAAPPPPAKVCEQAFESTTNIQPRLPLIDMRTSTNDPAPQYVSTLESFCQLFDDEDPEEDLVVPTSELFTRLIRRPKPVPQACSSKMEKESVYAAIDRIFASFTRADVCQPSGRRDLNSGEIAPIGVTALLEFLQLNAADVFGDIGSGTGSVLAQAAMQTLVQACVGLEIRSDLASKSRDVMQAWSTNFPSLSRVTVLTGDIRDDVPPTSKLAECTVILSNNLLFEHGANTSLQTFICSSHSIHTVLLTERVCYRCHSWCSNEFCKLWVLSKTISVVTCWSPKVAVFVYHKRHNEARRRQ
jgi:hypothetical protein